MSVSVGLTPTVCLKILVKLDAFSYPHSIAILSTGSVVSRKKHLCSFHLHIANHIFKIFFPVAFCTMRINWRLL